MNFSALYQKLRHYPSRAIVFLGLGNELRGEDGIGKLFLDQLARRPEFEAAACLYAGTTPENYLEQILSLQPQAVVIIDAVHTGEKLGTIGWVEDSDLANFSCSTHAYSPRLIAEYLRQSGPLDCYFLGITVRNTAPGATISAELLEAVHQFFQS